MLKNDSGPAVPVSDIRIVDPDTKKDLPTGQTGLLLVRGPQVMKLYVGDEGATRKTLDGDGWLDTGDVAEVDEEGFVYIRDRREFHQSLNLGKWTSDREEGGCLVDDKRS